MSLGAASLALFIGNIATYFGTKRTMLFMVLIVTVGWAQIIWASSVLMLYFGSFITGIAGGSFCVTVPLYTNEISQKEIRGSLGCLTQLMISFGILFATIVGKFLKLRNYFLVCAALPLLFGSIFIFMPDSPAYLFRNSGKHKAEESLKKLRGRKYNCELELKEIETALVNTRKTSGFATFKRSIKDKAVQKACFVGVGLMAFKVFSGIDAITTYLSLTLETAQMDIDEQYGTIIFGVIQVIASILQIFAVDTLGRRILLIFSETVMVICLFLIATAFYFKKHQIAEDYHFIINYVPLVFCCVFTIGYSMGLGPIPFMMCAEIFPSEIRNYMTSFCSFCVWTINFIVVKVFMVMTTYYGTYSCFFLFAGLSTIGLFFIYFCVPETKGLTFGEIQQKLAGR